MIPTLQRLPGVGNFKAFVVELMKPSEKSESNHARPGFRSATQLENVIIQARDVAEAAARSALQKRAVDVAKPFAHFDDATRA